jgi:hypothetical protein
MKMVTIGQAVIVLEQVFSADRYRCQGCGEFRFGTMGSTPICPLAEWGSDWIMQPARLEETQEEAFANMADLEARRVAAGF